MALRSLGSFFFQFILALRLWSFFFLRSSTCLCRVWIHFDLNSALCILLIWATTCIYSWQGSLGGPQTGCHFCQTRWSFGWCTSCLVSFEKIDHNVIWYLSSGPMCIQLCLGEVIEMGHINIQSCHVLVQIWHSQPDVCYGGSGIKGDSGYQDLEEHGPIFNCLVGQAIVDGDRGLLAAVFNLECTVIIDGIPDTCQHLLWHLCILGLF